MFLIHRGTSSLPSLVSSFVREGIMHIQFFVTDDVISSCPIKTYQLLTIVCVSWPEFFLATTPSTIKKYFGFQLRIYKPITNGHKFFKRSQSTITTERYQDLNSYTSMYVHVRLSLVKNMLQ